jgi:hypothetical protein
VFHFEQPIDLTSGFDLKMLFEKHFACPLGHFRISVTTSDHATATDHPFEVEEALAANDSSKREVLLRRFLETAPEMKQAAAQLAACAKNPPRGQPTLVMSERPATNPRATNRYHRGEYLSPKETVPPAVPAFLPSLPKDAPANRLTFAKWLFAPENPLTARVTVNRQWQAFFGRGLVKSLEDFGYQSEPPSHPELLDWLAVEFVKQGWSMKKLHRLIVTSATYKQSSRITPELAQRDPENILLARGARFRLDAEIIRDSALKAAGVLSPKMGGPGVYPPQPASITSEGTYGKFEWKTSEGEDRYPPQPLHLHQAHRPLRHVHHLRRPHRRSLPRQTRCLQQPAASPHAPQRPDVHGSRAGDGQSKSSPNRKTTTPASKTSSAAAPPAPPLLMNSPCSKPSSKSNATKNSKARRSGR